MTTLRFVPHKYKVFRLELASSILYRCLHRPSFLILGFLTRASTQRPYRSRPVALGVEIVEGWEVRARTTTKENGKHKMPFDGQGLTTKVVPSFCTFVDSGECTLCDLVQRVRVLLGSLLVSGLQVDVGPCGTGKARARVVKDKNNEYLQRRLLWDILNTRCFIFRSKKYIFFILIRIRKRAPDK